jgi:threonine synthase
MSQHFTSTRSENIAVSPSQAMALGISPDGGLFVPLENSEAFDPLWFVGKTYSQTAEKILGAYFSDFTDGEIKHCAEAAYNTKNFETQEIFTLESLGDFSFLELFRGRTLAFKDAALSVFPHLLRLALQKQGIKEKLAILVATSGDTGKAAMQAFGGIDGFSAIVFYPYEGVSEVQLLQMLTQMDSNASAVAVRGNFDDAQSAVKDVFADGAFHAKMHGAGYSLSSANSINIGRLFPQVAYYFYAYAKLIQKGAISPGDKVNFSVPSGNFGNILAGFYAMKAGLPVNKLIVASNDNTVLFDFFRSGIYDTKREFIKTISPSMDILVSSNLERLVYEAVGRDAGNSAGLMQQLSAFGRYELESGDGSPLKNFYASYATEGEARDAIKKVWEKHGYMMDTHTACGYKAYSDYAKAASDGCHTVILATASPLKFPQAVYEAAFGQASLSGIEYLHALSEKASIPIPAPLAGIQEKPRRQEAVIDSSALREYISSFLSSQLQG